MFRILQLFNLKNLDNLINIIIIVLFIKFLYTKLSFFWFIMFIFFIINFICLILMLKLIKVKNKILLFLVNKNYTLWLNNTVKFKVFFFYLFLISNFSFCATDFNLFLKESLNFLSSFLTLQSSNKYLNVISFYLTGYCLHKSVIEIRKFYNNYKSYKSYDENFNPLSNQYPKTQYQPAIKNSIFVDIFENKNQIQIQKELLKDHLKNLPVQPVPNLLPLVKEFKNLPTPVTVVPNSPQVESLIINELTKLDNMSPSIYEPINNIYVGLRHINFIEYNKYAYELAAKLGYKTLSIRTINNVDYLIGSRVRPSPYLPSFDKIPMDSINNEKFQILRYGYHNSFYNRDINGKIIKDTIVSILWQ